MSTYVIETVRDATMRRLGTFMISDYPGRTWFTQEHENARERERETERERPHVLIPSPGTLSQERGAA